METTVLGNIQNNIMAAFLPQCSMQTVGESCESCYQMLYLILDRLTLKSKVVESSVFTVGC